MLRAARPAPRRGGRACSDRSPGTDDLVAAHVDLGAREGRLDLAQVPIAGTDECGHQVRARNDDGGRGLGRRHAVVVRTCCAEPSAVTAAMVAAGSARPGERIARAPVDRFQCSMTRTSRSCPRIDSGRRCRGVRMPGRQRRLRAGRTSGRRGCAARGRGRTSPPSPGWATTRVIMRSARSPTCATVSPPMIGCVKTDQPGMSCGCRSCADPRTRRSPTPAGRRRPRPGRRTRPARRCRGPGCSGLVRPGASMPGRRRASAAAPPPGGGPRRRGGCRSGRCAAAAGSTSSRRGGRARRWTAGPALTARRARAATSGPRGRDRSCGAAPRRPARNPAAS